MLALQDRVEWRRRDGQLRPFLTGSEIEVAFAPQGRSQPAFLSCPAMECLLEGNRGGGKTTTLLMDFLQDVGRGLGRDWTGILFRQTYPQLRDVIEASMRWIPRIFPKAHYNISAHAWRFPDGELLYFRQMERPDDYLNFHGWNTQWLGWEELTNWATDVCYKKMFSTLRSPNARVRKRVRATCNPSGPGHNWVKTRFRLPSRGLMTVTRADKSKGILFDRVAIKSKLVENRVLLESDPDYPEVIAESAESDHEKAAWVDGSWDIVSGGMFDDIWQDGRWHRLPAIPFEVIPRRWRVDRAYDHGQSKPFSVGFWAESNGEPLRWKGHVIGPVKGDLIRIAEWYGMKSNKPDEGINLGANEIARGIKERVALMFRGERVVYPGPADSAIFDRYDGEKSVAGDMVAEGIRWESALKGPGSRVQGWQQVRKLMSGSIPVDGYREHPGLFVCENCVDFLRTVPTLTRDKKNPDDLDTKTEDHIADEMRYRVRKRDLSVRQKDF